MMNRWIELAHNRVNEMISAFVSGGMVATGTNKAMQSQQAIESSLTLSEWSTILGMAYISSMLLPRLYEFFKWLLSKFKRKGL